MQLRLKGRAALAAIALILGLLGWRATSARTALNGPASEAVRLQLVGEYADDLLPALRDDPEAHLDAIVRSEDIEITTLGVRGTGDNVVAKVEIQVRGGPPPDGESIRFYELEHTKLSGWRVRWETSEFQYRLKLF